ncbi:MAG: Gfo/Idh/MocA family oxidoreductase [Candidatus Omnitrophica bacterium]|nr:Gfo/Idh/MocA family oxidoreductase [Candidatus Omnitrophota bacterium]
MNPLDIALIGCGGIAQKGYLPALALTSAVRCLWLVDVQKRVAEELARRWRIPAVSDDYRAVLDRVEAVILAVPNHLHSPMTLDALARGKAVLCEKPLGRSASEVHTMATAAKQARVPLVAGMTFRQYPGLQAIHRAFPWEALGAIQEVRAGYGNPLDWPLCSPYLFDREKAGGGALLDQGVHAIDALLWVLSVEAATVMTYRDDGDSGVEAEASAHLTLRLPDGRGEVPCRLEVSRLRRLANRMEVVGERASLCMPLSSLGMPELRREGRMTPAVEPPVVPRTGPQCVAEQLNAFAQAVRGHEAACASGESQRPVLELIETCYRARQPLTFPWQAYVPWA